jgi:hypothetical protein
MKLIKPITYAEPQLISTTATEPIGTAWVIGTTYALADKVYYNGRLYESLIASNTGNEPGIPASITEWLDIGPDNRHAMFDTQVNTQTKATTTFTTVVNPNTTFNSLAYLNLTGITLDVVIRNGLAGPIVYSKSIDLDDTIIIDWYMYFFEPYDLKSDVVLTDVPAYSASHITTTITGVGNVAIGSMVYGSIYSLGSTQYGASIGIRDYSIKNTDAFGTTSFVQRAFSKRMDADIFVDNKYLNFTYKLLSDIRSVPVVWIGSEAEDFKPLVMFGYYRDFNITIPYPSYSLCNLSIEGLI